MKTFVLFLIISFLTINASAQVITRFTWETNPVTTAVAGVNAISVSSYPTVSTGGAKDTKGLNPGTGSHDINLTFDSTAFNVPAIDISVDFRREESQASFFYRNNFNFGMSGGNLSVSFQITNAMASLPTVNSGNVYSIPNDHSFHNYHFNYDNNTGVAKMWVDAVLVYTYTGTAGVPLYYTGAGNLIVGKDMDATGRNLTILDNFIVQKYASAILPVKLISFTAEAKSIYATINWTTTQETNATSYVVEHSSNGSVFSAIKTIATLNGYSNVNYYQFTDSMPFNTVSYYRLKMVNADGNFTYSGIRSVTVINAAKAEITVYPNPAVNYVTVKMNNTKPAKYHYTVSSITGQVISSADVLLNSGAQQIQIDLTKIILKGAILIQVSNILDSTTQTFTVIKK